MRQSVLALMGIGSVRHDAPASEALNRVVLGEQFSVTET